MPTYSKRKGTRRSEHWRHIIKLAGGLYLLGNLAVAQIYLPKAPPPPADYGRIIFNSTSKTGPGPVIFDHWLHRAKFTCRVCHVDIGFAMQANATGITATTNHEGYHCGACHDGKRVLDGKVIFASCSDGPEEKSCDRCHSIGTSNVRQYDYDTFTSKFPKGVYGVNWELAEQTHVIQPIDFIDGLSMTGASLKNRKDFVVKPAYSWVHPIAFSHEKHTIWNGCELCHPDIFPAAQKGTVHYSMFLNIEGRYCGACHGKVASPLNNCQKCHPNAPPWAQ